MTPSLDRVRIWGNKGWLRLLVVWRILFRQYRHWVILNVDEDNLAKLLDDEQKDLKVESVHCGLQLYNVHQLVKRVTQNITDEEMILEKATFQGEVELLKRSKAASRT